MELARGTVVRSVAGRDAGSFLAVVAFDGADVYVCDGKARPLERPKRKNPRHIRPTRCVLDETILTGNKSLKQALGAFAARQDKEA